MCTDFILPFEKDSKTIISGRTMDFSLSPKNDLIPEVVKIPKGLKFKSKGSKRKNGHSWENKHGFIGVWMRTESIKSPEDPTTIAYNDGLNTKGLSAGALWLTYSEYEEPGDTSLCVEIDYAVSYMLGMCATVGEVKKNLDKLTVWFPE